MSKAVYASSQLPGVVADATERVARRRTGCAYSLVPAAEVFRAARLSGKRFRQGVSTAVKRGYLWAPGWFWERT